jgi:hypothetical protein
MPTNINFVEKLDAGCDTQVSFNLPKTLSLGTVKKSLDNNGLSEAEGCSYLALNRLNETGLLNKASLVINPSSFSENALYADVPANSTLGDFAFTRATDAWRTNSQGLIQRTPWNLLRSSEQFNISPWAMFTGPAVLPNTAIAPNGALTADTLRSSGGTNDFLYQTYNTLIIGVTYTISIYIKNIDSLGSYIWGANGSASIFDINWSGSTISSVTNGATFVDVGNNWYRVTHTSVASSATTIIRIYSDKLNTSKSVYIWGAQLVEGSSPLEYFPTTDRQDVPRIDYSLGGCPNILLEPQRTNLVLWSEQFDNAAWSKNAATITANSAISPSGIQNADTYTADGTVSFKSVFQTGASTLSSGVTYTTSIYAKKNTNNFIQLVGSTFPYGSTNVFANFDLNNGVVGSVGSLATATITSVGNDWYRCTMTATATVTTNLSSFICQLVTSATAVRGEINTLSTSVFLWGAQLEAGAYATSYIPTISASVTRNADVINRNNVFTNGFITASGGTWFVDIRNNVARLRDGASTGIYLDTGSGLINGFAFRNGATSTRIQIWKSIASAGANLFTTTADTAKIAIKWDGTTADIFQNGIKVVSATPFTPTNMQNLNGIASDILKYINSMMLFPTPLSDAECIQLTT